MAIISLPNPISPANGDWNSSPDAQYHIQTDEGPERYFRYQTISGQYRKEKRLEDGTVIGSYGWVDADGFLRLRDYIADGQGYRILKTKNIFVGKDRPIGEAVYTAKRTKDPSPVVATKEIIPTTQLPAYKPTTYAPPTYVTTTYAPTDTITITPKPVEVTTVAPLAKYIAITRKPSAIGIFTTTEAPYETLSPKFESIRIRGYTPSHEPYVQILPNSLPSTATPIASTTPSPIAAITSNSLDYDYKPSYDPNYDEDYRKTYSILNGPTYPIDRHGNVYTGYNNKIGNGYDPQYPYYDGVSVTNDGFRYYLPRQYHEEQNLGGERRSGSFGYIDPFGIRRVIYYNTAPGSGFQHRKNNRYVGFDATPYDPRPYRK